MKPGLEQGRAERGPYGLPAVDLVIPELAPPWHNPIYEDNARREQCYPADEDTCDNVVACIVCYDGTCMGQEASQTSIVLISVYVAGECARPNAEETCLDAVHGGGADPMPYPV